jgi:hypothetical protein
LPQGVLSSHISPFETASIGISDLYRDSVTWAASSISSKDYAEQRFMMSKTLYAMLAAHFQPICCA